MSHTRLNLPFTFFGLSKVNSYIENFYMGVDKPGDWSQKWNNIIPNSQLFVSPTDDNPSNWKIEIFINPTKELLIIIFSTFISLIVLGFFIWYFYRKEKLEDHTDEGELNVF